MLIFFFFQNGQIFCVVHQIWLNSFDTNFEKMRPNNFENSLKSSKRPNFCINWKNLFKKSLISKSIIYQIYSNCFWKNMPFEILKNCSKFFSKIHKKFKTSKLLHFIDKIWLNGFLKTLKNFCISWQNLFKNGFKFTKFIQKSNC